MRVKKRGVSTIIAELLLIVITVAIGTIVYSFASTAFGGFGAGFSNLVQSEGSQLAENVVVEQVYFFNNGTAPPCPSAGAGTNCSGDLFIRNTGSNTVVISQVYVTNVTANTPVTSATPPLKTDLNFYAYNAASTKWDIILPTLDDALPTTAECAAPNACIASMLPGQSVMLKFYAYDTLAPGTVYAFTLVTARGNQFVAYEKA